MIFQNQQFSLFAQYTCDLSVENPNPLILLNKTDNKLETDVDIQVQAQPWEEEGLIEVKLVVKMKVLQEPEKIGYLMEITHSGIVGLAGDLQEEQARHIVWVQVPQILLPSVRHVLSMVSQSSGLPPFVLQNVNFEELLAQNAQSSTNIHPAS